MVRRSTQFLPRTGVVVVACACQSVRATQQASRAGFAQPNVARAKRIVAVLDCNYNRSYYFSIRVFAKGMMQEDRFKNVHKSGMEIYEATNYIIHRTCATCIHTYQS